MHALWQAVFGNERPVEIEIGPGTGTFILAAAQRAPHVNFLGLERSWNRAGRLKHLIDARGLRNARVIAADAACIVVTLIPPESVTAYHIYFPDPWWKRRHHRRRLFTAAFAAALARTLTRDGRLHVASDVEETFALMRQSLADTQAFRHGPLARPQRDTISAFEHKGLNRGATIRDAVFVKRELPLRQTNSAAPMTPAESPSELRTIGVRSSSLNM